MNTIIDIIMFFLLASIPAGFSFFLDYALGHPMSDDKVSPKAIFFGYSLALAKNALPDKKQEEIEKFFRDQLSDSDPSIRIEAKQRMNEALMKEGRKYFFFQQAFGMCPFCSNFWVAFIAANIYMFHIPTLFFHGIFYLITIPVFSHVILRKL